MEPGDVVVDQLGGGRVVAHHDEAGRHLDTGLAPLAEDLLVVAVERVEGGLQRRGNAQGIEHRRLGAPRARHLGADVLPQVAERGHLAAGDVVRHRHARQLDDAALDRVHQGEVAHRPREQRALRVAGAAQEERRGRQVDHPAQTQPALHRFEAGNPHPRGFAVLACLPAVVRRQAGLVVVLRRLLAVAVMRLVVERHDVLHAHQAGHDALQYLPLALQRVQLRAAALQQGASAARDVLGLARHEGVVVGDDDGGAVQVAEHVARHQLAALVVAVRVVGLQHAQAVADGQAGGHHQEAAREPPSARMAHRVDRLPRDQHRHHRGLAGAGGELQRQPREAGVGLLVRLLQPLDEPPPLTAGVGGYLGEPDHRLHRLHLAEERTQVAELVVAPMLEQAGGLRGNPPPGARQPAPLVHAVAHALDHPHQLVLLTVLVRRGAGIVQAQLGLSRASLAGGGNRRDERHGAPAVDDPVGGLAALVQFPVPRRVLVRRIQDRLLKEPLRHSVIVITRPHA